MGFFDKLKSVKNMITGGAAKVDLQVQDFCIGETFNVHVNAMVGDVSVNMEKVYLYVEGWHEVEATRVIVEEDSDGYPYERVEHFTDSHKTYNFKCELGEKGQLDANKTYTWDQEVLIPEGSMECFNNGAERQYYRFCAGIDVTGNDPDSGWIIIE
ncbi:MAG: hypothetical protein KC646_07510 [Candidatus Cloacimonetes bacterium]|nr:hypothetical protein [Candidatus Cloacimonadota bacterium]